MILIRPIKLLLLHPLTRLHLLTRLKLLKKRINRNPQRVIQQLRNNPRQQRAARLEARIRVDLDEVQFEGVVEHEVEAEDFELVEPLFGVDFQVDGLESVGDEPLYLALDVAVEVYLQVRMCGI